MKNWKRRRRAALIVCILIGITICIITGLLLGWFTKLQTAKSILNKVLMLTGIILFAIMPLLPYFIYRYYGRKKKDKRWIDNDNN